MKIKIDSGIIVDVGCGYGGFIEDIDDYKGNFDFVGIDTSKSMIDIANKVNKKVNAQFIVGKAEKTKLKAKLSKPLTCNDDQ